MFRFLIVDDEKVICSLIEHLIDWEKLGFRCIGSVNTGIDALEKIRQEKPELVISDIRMPGLDGIALVKETVEAGGTTKFIMVSGFRQFEYAHGAMQYGVRYYLLKPLDKEELERTVRKVYQELSMEREKEDAIGQIGAIRKKVKEHFLLSSLNPDTDAENSGILIPDVNAEYETAFQEGVYQAVLVKLDTLKPESTDLAPVLASVRDYAHRIEACCTECIQAEMNSGLFILMNYPPEKEGEIREEITALYRDVSEYLKRFEGFQVTIGVGARYKDISHTADCLSTAADAVKYRVRYPEKPVICYEDHVFSGKKPPEIFDSGHRKEIRRAVESGDSDLLLNQFNTDTSAIELLGISSSPLLLYDLCEEYYEELKGYLKETALTDPEIEELLTRWQVRIDQDRSELMLRVDTKKMLAAVCTRIQAELGQRAVRPAREARDYIRAHYTEDISLTYLADMVGLNASYLSTIFKKEFGMSFSDYILECRMEEARELISSTRLPLAEVAEKVGYHDARYFSRLFLKYTGLKPSVYRKLYS